MTHTSQTWTEVGEHLNALALKLKLHAEEELSDEGRAFQSALATLRDATKAAFDGIEEVLDDDALRNDIRAAAEALGNAFRSTMHDVRGAMQSES